MNGARLNEIPVVFFCGGQQLVGMWHEAVGSKPAPAVVFFHGFTGNKSEAHRIFVQQARRLAKEGIGCLRFDFRGSGDSEGEFVEMTVAAEREDAEAALEWVRRHPDVDPARIGILGISMGGMIAAFAMERHPELCAAVLWNPVGFPAAIRDRRNTPESLEELRKFGVVNRWGFAVSRAFLEEMDHLKPVEAAPRGRVPTLIVIGTADESVPPDDGRAYEAALRSAGIPCRLHAIEGADHTFSAFSACDECLDVTTKWFRERLLEKRQGA